MSKYTDIYTIELEDALDVGKHEKTTEELESLHDDIYILEAINPEINKQAVFELSHLVVDKEIVIHRLKAKIKLLKQENENLLSELEIQSGTW